MLSGNGTSVYHPRQPQLSPLRKLLDTHYETFERDYEQKFFKTTSTGARLSMMWFAIT
jgi:hypothetical protein